ncbi:hypothetical protein pEaSNUABM13_00194 [Erwinia phage pEa_SNUABM_13]|nr:hypothetical protein pEaSNUABM13_00194 [Erwinia phage pEa_SNUABM_13]
MQYHLTNYGVFDKLCPQVFAFDDQTSLLDNAASPLDVVNKSLFTLGINGQANTVSGVAASKRYASNLKWAYSAMPNASNIHTGTTLAGGCSLGQEVTALAWTPCNTIFFSNDTTLRSRMFYGRTHVRTGAQSPSLTISALMVTDANNSFRVARVGKVELDTYNFVDNPPTFRYIRCESMTINASSYSYTSYDDSDMILYLDTTENDTPRNPFKYECVFNNRLFRFSADDIFFGQNLIAGTRPMVQSYFTRSYTDL